MTGLDYWRLCDELSVVNAALLILGVDPSNTGAWEIDCWNPRARPKGHDATEAALIGAITSGRLQAKVKYDLEPRYEAISVPEHSFSKLRFKQWREVKDSSNNSYLISPVPNWETTTVDVDDLKKWLRSKGVTSDFFFPTESHEGPTYLDPTHSRYAPKLAAAVQAWLAVVEPKGTSPKKALEKWLREHAAEFGLTDDEGTPVAIAMEECAKVANWQPGGGASKTPG